LLEYVSQSPRLSDTSGTSPFVHSSKGPLSDEFKELVIWNGSVCSRGAVNDHLVHVLCILDLLVLCAGADRREWIQMVRIHV
jgi:hypothetical protein